jgi:alkanesulfonate monooxygenase SsuD/methylene tetrahydromethanopterin reductase-like flavin-dependent oxidoreductase (luciferase family)
MTLATDQPSADPRAATNPIFNDNTFKLGLFCHNASVIQMSTAPEKYSPTWPRSLEIARLADAIGLEAIVSFAGWRGAYPDDPKHRSHREYEPFTWAAAMAAVTRYPAIIGTFHAQLTSPAFVAKAATTIDHITGGRAGLNVVAGSSRLAFAQFGQTIEEHDTRYEHTDEFVAVMKKFWSAQEEFDFDGRFMRVRHGISEPKPIQQPYPPLINAGVSERGRNFAACHADIALTHLRGSDDDWRGIISAYKALAASEYRRAVQVWTHGYVVVGETEAEANDYLRYYAEERADKRWVDAWVAELGENAPKLRPDQLVHMSRNWAAGGGQPLVGTPEMIVDRIARYSRAGLDGMLLTALEPEKMLGRMQERVMPLLVQAGLRRRHAVAAG